MKRLGWTLAACLAIGCGGSTIDDLSPDRDDAGADARRDTGADAGRDPDAAAKPDLGVDARDGRADAIVDVSTDPRNDGPPDATPDRIADVAVDRPRDVALDQRSDGACAIDCATLPNVRPGAPVDCINGRCYVPPGSCVTGFAHCSARPEDGCEAELSKPTSCGGCGFICYGSYKCALVNSRYQCVIDCSTPGDTNCSNACVNLTKDPWNCGECYHNCFTDNPHATLSCVDSKCKIDACDDGYGDCNAEPGCESRLDTADNCGACGKKQCAYANATAPCISNGACQPTCNSGFANCDKTSLDCESPSATATCWPHYLGTSALGGTPLGTTSAALLADGTHFVGGDFNRAADFDPGPGLDLHTPVAPADAFVVKLNPDGALAWAKTFGGDNSEQVTALAAGADGSVVAVGHYSSTVDFDPGPGVDSHTASFDQEPFVVKFAADGSFVWARTLSIVDGGWADAFTVSVAGDGAVYVGGSFEGRIDLDPGPGTAIQEGNSQGYLVKLSSAGTFIWGSAVGGPDCGWGTVQRTTLAGDGTLWVAGGLDGTCSLGPTDPDRDQSFEQQTFVAAFSPAGAYQKSWRLSMYSDRHSLSIAPDDSVYLGGEFGNVVDFDPGPGTVERAPPLDGDGNYMPAGFVVKFGKDGTFRWVMAFPTLDVDSVAALADGVLAIGDLMPQNNVKPGVGLTKLDAAGVSVFSATIGGSSTNSGTLAVAGSRFVVVGSTDGLADFDPGLGTDIVDRGAVNFASRYSF
jgi:hypothetical protein